MKKTIFITIISATAIFSGCTKSNSNSATTVTESQVLSDFINKIALPEYQTLQEHAIRLNNAVVSLNAQPNAANLAAAQQAWRDTRTSWETCEGFLFGPVEDNSYDGNTDAWPVDFRQIDSLIANSPSLNVNTVQNLTQSLRGYHPLEFILWGQHGNATADSITADQKQYMVALSQDILNNIDSLNSSWAASGGNFQQQVLLAGKGSTRFKTNQEAFLTIIGSISDICNEVGEQSSGGKIYDPYFSRDSFQTESPFSHNSMVDFRNNIIGAQNAYLCTFNGQQGASISNFVAMHNIALDNKIKQEFSAAIQALNNVNVTFETAIFLQRTQLQSAMNALNALQATLDSDLTIYIQSYVRD